MSGLLSSLQIPITKRRVFFSFHYQNDIWRVNQVRNSWRFNQELSREAEGFYDASIWESSKRTGPESLKSLIREGIKNTSVTCVLVGSHTFERRWVRYEIARSVSKANGLLAVQIHRMGNQRGFISNPGPNPLDYMGLYKAGEGIYLAEYHNGRWIKYGDFSQPISVPSTWVKPHNANVIPLCRYARLYCYTADMGSSNFSLWVKQAATDVGR